MPHLPQKRSRDTLGAPQPVQNCGAPNGCGCAAPNAQSSTFDPIRSAESGELTYICTGASLELLLINS